MHHNHSNTRWWPLRSTHTPAMVIRKRERGKQKNRGERERTPASNIFCDQSSPFFPFVYNSIKMIYSFSPCCRCAVEPGWNVWWKTTHAGVSLSAQKREDNEAGDAAKKQSFSSPNRRYVILSFDCKQTEAAFKCERVCKCTLAWEESEQCFTRIRHSCRTRCWPFGKSQNLFGEMFSS